MGAPVVPVSELFAGIDGGQSATYAVVGDERGRILGRGSAGPADEIAQSSRSTRLRDALQGALEAALRHARPEGGASLQTVVAGISGYDGKIYGAPPQLPAKRTILLHDAPIAHAGAFAGGDGAVVIAGTGCVAYACERGGAATTVGGWGYLFGDEGSAFGTVRDALAAAMRASDEGARSPIEAPALGHFAQSSLRELVRAFYAGAISRDRLAALAPQVFEAMPECVAASAGALVRLAMLAVRALRARPAPVAFTGGMLKSRALREAIEGELRSRPDVLVVPARYDAACGALLLAYRNGGAGPLLLQDPNE